MQPLTGLGRPPSAAQRRFFSFLPSLPLECQLPGPRGTDELAFCQRKPKEACRTTLYCIGRAWIGALGVKSFGALIWEL